MDPQSKQPWIWRSLRWLGLLTFVIGLIRTAWVAEDAYITFRTIDNFFHGYGLRWNVAERVQTYSHPLWMFLMALGHGLTGEYYYTALVAGATCTALVLYLVGFRLATSLPGAVLALFVLACSRFFVDYSTSGLEAPLTHLLIAIFAALVFSPLPAKQRLLGMALVAGLAGVNRLDTLLLFAPALCFAGRGLGFLAWSQRMALGFLPLLAWLLFATFYYGTPLPITAYAKAFTGIPGNALLSRGVLYYRDVAIRDPILLPSLLIGLWVSLRWRSVREAGLALGAILYCLYIAKIGGGYMSGRFLTPSLLVGAILISRIVWTPRWSWLQPTMLAGGVALSLAVRSAPILSAKDFSTVADLDSDKLMTDGRGICYSHTGWLSDSRSIPEPDSLSKLLGFASDPDNPLIFFDGVVGWDGFMAGPGVHFVDPVLCDPLLMRLPAWNQTEWIAGHFVRRVPEGYLQSVALGKNLMEDPGLAKGYADLCEVTRGNLWSRRRLMAIWSLAFGAGKRGIEAYAVEGYRNLEPEQVRWSELPETWEEGGSVWNEDFHIVESGGLQIQLPTLQHNPKIRLVAGARAEYSLSYLQGPRTLASTVVSVGETSQLFPGIQSYEADVPPEAVESGYDAILVTPLKRRRSGIHCLATIQFP
ncbi:MAG: hypothetical protein H6830_04395 [Planctomycetes bacterium]|nr:hypothetical protein [Planctomycetota bacterium]MCB9912601.1 hypothetical protein [Planctomycetota bacterium]HPF13657.1 hypothetical protein [Planctomycetota bacterium]